MTIGSGRGAALRAICVAAVLTGSPAAIACEGVGCVGQAVGQGMRETGHAVQKGARVTGNAVGHGLRATGHVVEGGVRATGHALSAAGHETKRLVTGSE